MKKMHEQMARLYEAGRQIGVLNGDADQTTLARLLSVAQQNVNNWEARGVSKEGLLEAQHRLGINATWVLTGKGPTLVGGPVQVPIADGVSPGHGFVRFELLDVAVSAGSGKVASAHPDILEHVDVLESWARHSLGAVAPAHVKLVVCRGDSMSPTIQDGDVVFVDTQRREYQGDGIYVLDWQGRLLVKRLRLLSDGRLVIQSDNQAPYPPEYVGQNNIDQLTICGTALAWWALKRY